MCRWNIFTSKKRFFSFFQFVHLLKYSSVLVHPRWPPSVVYTVLFLHPTRFVLRVWVVHFLVPLRSITVFIQYDLLLFLLCIIPVITIIIYRLIVSYTFKWVFFRLFPNDRIKTLCFKGTFFVEYILNFSCTAILMGGILYVDACTTSSGVTILKRKALNLAKQKKVSNIDNDVTV